MTDLLEGLRPDVREAIESRGLLKDPEIVATLGNMVPESRRQVLHRIGSLGKEWAQAKEGAEYVEDDPTEGETKQDVNPNRMVMSFRRDSLTPNKWNASLFPDSLSGESVEVLAESLKSGQRVPIEITNSHVIVDGERRWRAAEFAGLEMVDVIYVGDLTDEEILDRVLDSCVSTRQPSPREKALVYKAVYQRLQETLGRKHGERLSNENISSPKELKVLAIKRAGISSVMMAERLTAIFDKAPEEIQEKVNSGEMSVAAGYEQVPKRPRKKAPEEPQPEDETDTRRITEDGVWVNPFAGKGRLPDGTIVTHSVAEGEKSDPPMDHTRADPHDEQTNESEIEEAQEMPDQDGGELDVVEDEEREEDAMEATDISVDKAVEVLAQHLEELVADEGLKAARATLESWVRRLFEWAKAARSLAA